jgi:hypothetical protein
MTNTYQVTRQADSRTTNVGSKITERERRQALD